MDSIPLGKAYKPSEQNSGIIQPHDIEYPEAIKQCIKRPPVLYWRGNRDLLSSEYLLAIVGSRITTPTNIQSLNHVLRPLRDDRIVIVSGLARGLDGLAHTVALENSMPTIAILGSSIERDEIYPRSHIGLAERIVHEGGLLLSPFPPHTPIMNYNFPMRNQIMAALCQTILIASAAKKSGALITARFGLDFGKNVLVIPGPVGQTLFEGSNMLLADGARPILNADDLMQQLGLTPMPIKNYDTDSPEEARIIQQLRQEPQSMNELCMNMHINVSNITQFLTTLELKGWIECGGDGRFHLR